MVDRDPRFRVATQEAQETPETARTRVRGIIEANGIQLGDRVTIFRKDEKRADGTVTKYKNIVGPYQGESDDQEGIVISEYGDKVPYVIIHTIIKNQKS
jgi:hypothetical protein